jgi:hypothetical protein
VHTVKFLHAIQSCIREPGHLFANLYAALGSPLPRCGRLALGFHSQQPRRGFTNRACCIARPAAARRWTNSRQLRQLLPMDVAGPRIARTCPDCRACDFVEDHAAGDIICKVLACTLPSMQPCEVLADSRRLCRAAGLWLRLTS